MGTSTGWSSSIRLTTFSPGMSSAVTTTTRLQSKPSPRSIPSRRAWGSVERMVAPYHAPAKTRSSAYLASPVSLSGPSRRSGGAAGPSARCRVGRQDQRLRGRIGRQGARGAPRTLHRCIVARRWRALGPGSCLADLQQMAVRVTEEGARFPRRADRRRQELRAPSTERVVGRLAVGDAHGEGVIDPPATAKVTSGLSSVGPPPVTSRIHVPARRSTHEVPPYSR